MAGIGKGASADKYNTLVEGMGYLGNRIRMSLGFLCEYSTNLKGVIVYLISHGLLIQRESEIVGNQLSDFDGFYNLFTFILPRLAHGDNSLHFVNAFLLSGNEHILEELKRAVVTTDFAPRSVDTSSRSIRFNVQEPVQSFVGRNNFLIDLDQQILQRNQAAADVTTTSTIISRICVVTGLGGIGKTETIRKYIHSYGHCYQHVVWIDAEEHKTAENQFRRLALLVLKLPSKDILDIQENRVKDFDALVEDIYNCLCTSHTLLILDNAEALHDSDPQRPGVRRFIPTSLPPTHLKPVVIITSRHQDWLDLHSTPLPILTLPESSAFLFHQLNLKESDANGKDAESLFETFGGLPLALHAAVAVIRQESKWNELLGKDVYTIQHLLSDYNQEKRKVLQKRPPCSPDTQPLLFLWKVSLDKIRQQPQGHLATQILNVMAHLSPTNISKDFLFSIFNNDEDLKKAVELLVDYSFVHNSRSHFSIHRVLQDVTLAHLETPKEEFNTEGLLILVDPPLIRITTALKKYWPTLLKCSEAYDAVHDNLVHVTMSHVLPKLLNPSKTDLHFIEFIEFVLHEIKSTRWVEAEKCCRVLIAYFANSTSILPPHSASHFTSPNFKKVMRLRRQLAGILEMMGRYKKAVDICQELLSFLNSLEDQEDVIKEILYTKHYLASILNSQGEHEEAIKLLSSVLDLRSKLHGPTHAFTLETKNNLALALLNSGRLNEAKTIYEEMLKVEMKDLGPQHPDTLTTRHNMAVILEEEGRYDDALEMHREVAEVWKRELGPLHANTLNSKICMADVLSKQGKNEDALRLYADVISCYEKASAASHPDCLRVKDNMAVILFRQEKVDEAKEMLCHVLDTRERLLGPSHKYTLTTKHNLAFALFKQGKFAEALRLYEEVAELRIKQLGPKHPSTLQTYHTIGWLHLKMGNFEKAESIAKEVLAVRRATLPSDHPDCKNTEELYEMASSLTR